MKGNFKRCLPLVLKHEGGYVNHPRDPGGATNKGITHRTYDDWRRHKGLPARSVKAITDAEVAAIYKAQYWDAVRGDELPLGVDYAVFDYAVNSGPGRAAKDLQRVVRIGVDGSIGVQTLRAVGALPPASVINGLCDRRLAFLKGLTTWRTFGKGWTRRVAGVRGAALNMLSLAPLADVPAPRAEPTPKADPADTAMSKTQEGVGGGMATVGAAGSAATEAAQELSLLAQYSDIIKYAFIALMLIGVGLTIFAMLRKRREQ